jgi:flagellar biosynthesis protein FlhA
MVALVVGVLVVLFTPIPSGLLDFLILANFSFAFLILLLTFYMGRPVEFSTFPSLLLIATLFRLSLNVAATRLILSQADAGKVIGAIGSYVVRGNYVIGLIVFLILIVVQYVVVTNGAQRVSEVAARFTLDSMPGQQMSIDADLNMGFIDQAEAQRRRKNLEKEAAFYGAMDGASKFVKGDAIAGILILLINIIGGMVIGVMQGGMSWPDAMRTYTLLTIGDGIVTQVPALVIAVGTGIIVTRSAADGNLGKEALRQITSSPKTLVLVGLTLAAMLALPGIPAWPALALLTLVAVGAVGAWRASAKRAAASALPDADQVSEDQQGASDDPYAALAVDPIEVFVGTHWAQEASLPSGPLMERISVFRQQHALDYGVVLPRVRFRDAARLSPFQYEIHIDGVLVGRGEARADRLLAIHPNGDMKAVPGEPTKDPTYGLPALWIEPRHRETAAAARYTLVDAHTVLLTHLTEVLRKESATLLTRSEVEKLLERVRKSQPSLLEELLPTVLSVSDVQRVLQGLLKEKVSIRHLEAILETLADAGRQTKDPALLVERVRQRLGPAICQQLVGEGAVLQVLTLDPTVEGQLTHGLRQSEHQAASLLDPVFTQQVVTRLIQQSERMMKSNLLPVVLCSPDLRRHLRTLTERVLPHLRLLAMTEVPANIELRSFGVVNVEAATAAARPPVTAPATSSVS